MKTSIRKSATTVWLGGLLAVLLTAGGGCGSDGPEHGADYGDLLASPGGLLVLAEEHPSGFGRPDCFLCHEIRNMHVENRTSLPDCDAVSAGEPCIDLGEIQSLISDDGEDSCQLCHGTNGVPE